MAAGGSTQVFHGGGAASVPAASVSVPLASSVHSHSRMVGSRNASVSPSRRTAFHGASTLGFAANGVVASVEDLRRDSSPFQRSVSPGPAGRRAFAGSLVPPPPLEPTAA